VTDLTMSVYTFCWPVRTLRGKDEEGSLAEAKPGHGGWAGGSSQVNPRVARLSIRAMQVSHEDPEGIDDLRLHPLFGCV
jgi:hypothetical protein